MSDMCLNMLLRWQDVALIRYKSNENFGDLDYADAIDMFYFISQSIPFSCYAICF
jgi:hypothetical protein